MLTTDVGQADYSWAYGYDGIYQLLTADRGEPVNRMIDYQYDTVYNRSYWNDSSQGSLTYTDNTLNQYTSIGSRTPSYDGRGNLTCIGQWWSMTYDCENRMTSAVNGVYRYGYDLLGRRTLRRAGTGSYQDTVYVWDGAQIMAEYKDGSLIRKYIYGPGMDNPVMMLHVSGAAETRYYYYPDALGSIRLLSNGSGEIVESYTYDPFGMPCVMTSAGGSDDNWLTEDVSTYSYSPVGNPYMFAGRRWDRNSKLYYYRFRDYSPDLGRFCQPDPAGYIDTMNLYAYVGNNPLNWIDPWGLSCNFGDMLYPIYGEYPTHFNNLSPEQIQEMYRQNELAMEELAREREQRRKANEAAARKVFDWGVDRILGSLLGDPESEFNKLAQELAKENMKDFFEREKNRQLIPEEKSVEPQDQTDEAKTS